LTTPIHHHQSIEIRVEFLERVFIGTPLSGVLGEEVRVHCQVERAESSQGFRGGDVTNGGEASPLVAQVSVQCIVVDWTLKL
jgi:acyl-coenzyme A thioesterase PaaI-like protein